jgi:hypothetical protein
MSEVISPITSEYIRQGREDWLLGRCTNFELFARPVESSITDCPECATTPTLPTDGFASDLYKCECGASWTIHANYARVKYERLSHKSGQIKEFEMLPEDN